MGCFHRHTVRLSANGDGPFAVRPSPSCTWTRASHPIAQRGWDHVKIARQQSVLIARVRPDFAFRVTGRRGWKRMNLAVPFSLSKPLVKTEKAPTNRVYAECQTLSGELLLMFRRKRFGYHYIRQHGFKARRIIRIIHSANAIDNLNRLTSGNRMN